MNAKNLIFGTDTEFERDINAKILKILGIQNSGIESVIVTVRFKR